MPGLPQYLEPLRLVETREILSGELQVEGMQRLNELLHEHAGSVRFRLSFERDDQGRVCIRGEFSTRLALTCQRCLEPVPVDVTGPIDVALVTDDREAEQLPGGVEPVMMQEWKIHLPAFLEEEILLSLPLVPAHTAGECGIAGAGTAEPVPLAGPFAVLQRWKSEKRDP
ncbi:MAG: DUF177 domain-containing protein [Gammaproteobacteria bacterium]|nr:DUF177 domain-containing protein [Gammaproteobacteria bacterium]